MDFKLQKYPSACIYTFFLHNRVKYTPENFILSNLYLKYHLTGISVDPCRPLGSIHSLSKFSYAENATAYSTRLHM